MGGNWRRRRERNVHFSVHTSVCVSNVELKQTIDKKNKRVFNDKRTVKVKGNNSVQRQKNGLNDFCMSKKREE